MTFDLIQSIIAPKKWYDELGLSREDVESHPAYIADPYARLTGMPSNPQWRYQPHLAFTPSPKPKGWPPRPLQASPVQPPRFAFGGNGNIVGQHVNVWVNPQNQNGPAMVPRNWPFAPPNAFRPFVGDQNQPLVWNQNGPGGNDGGNRPVLPPNALHHGLPAPKTPSPRIRRRLMSPSNMISPDTDSLITTSQQSSLGNSGYKSRGCSMHNPEGLPFCEEMKTPPSTHGFQTSDDDSQFRDSQSTLALSPTAPKDLHPSKSKKRHQETFSEPGAPKKKAKMASSEIWERFFDAAPAAASSSSSSAALTTAVSATEANTDEYIMKKFLYDDP